MKFVFEIFSEHIPTTMQRNAAKQLEALTISLSKGSIKKFKTFCTSRRFVLIIDDLSSQITMPDIKVKGPKQNVPESVLQKFCESKARDYGLDILEVEKGLIAEDEYWYIDIKAPKTDSKSFLISLCKEIFENIHWPNKMKWHGENSEYANVTYIRPIRSIIALLSNEVLDIKIAGIQANNVTRLEDGSVLQIKNAEEYESDMLSNGVLLSYSDREKILTDFLKEYEYEENLEMFEEIAGSTEHGNPFIVELLDNSILTKLPNQFIIECVQEHQQAVAIYNSKNKNQYNERSIVGFVLLSQKPATPNMKKDCSQVLQARLMDMLFFFEEDKANAKKNIEQREEQLKGMPVHEKLGTLNEKCDRLHNMLRLSQDDELAQAALFFKLDAFTKTVNELPKLTGHALYHIYDSLLSTQIRTIARELSQNNTDQMSVQSLIIGLLDSLDTLVGFFIISQIPTGSQDPFGLRRLANQVALYGLELYKRNTDTKKANLSNLSSLIHLAYEQYSNVNVELDKESFNINDKEAMHAVCQKLFEFIMERMKYIIDSKYHITACVQNTYEASGYEAFAKPELLNTQTAFWNIEQRTIDIVEFRTNNPEKVELIAQVYKRTSNFIKNAVSNIITNDILDSLSLEILTLAEVMNSLDMVFQTSKKLSQLFDNNLILEESYRSQREYALQKLHEKMLTYCAWDML